MLKVMAVSKPFHSKFHAEFSAYRWIDIFKDTFAFVAAIVLRIIFLDKEEIVRGTRNEDSMTLRLSSLRMITGKCIEFAIFFF